jgi:hypothetical protein
MDNRRIGIGRDRPGLGADSASSTIITRGFIPEGVKSLGVKSTTRFHLVPRLSTHKAVFHCPYVFIVWC